MTKPRWESCEGSLRGTSRPTLQVATTNVCRDALVGVCKAEPDSHVGYVDSEGVTW